MFIDAMCGQTIDRGNMRLGPLIRKCYLINAIEIIGRIYQLQSDITYIVGYYV